MTPATRPVPSLIEVSGLSASYGRVAALKPVDLRVDEGEFVTILGPNGAGKTTLLRAISRLIESSGHVRFKGEDITALSAHRLAKLGIIMVQEGRGLFTKTCCSGPTVSAAIARRSNAASRRSSGCFRVCASAPRKSRRQCPAASSRCLRSDVR